MRIFKPESPRTIFTLTVNKIYNLKHFTLQPLRCDNSKCAGCGKRPQTTDAAGWKFVGVGSTHPNFTLCPTHWPEFRSMFLRALLGAET